MSCVSSLQYVEDPARFPELNPISLLEQTMCGLSHLHSLNIGLRYTHIYIHNVLININKSKHKLGF